MTAEQVESRVRRELGDLWPLPIRHDLDLTRCLVLPPVKEIFADSFTDDEPLELWLVLDERPEVEGGYKIVYDEADDIFGLVIGNTFIGYYGSFLETLQGM